MLVCLDTHYLEHGATSACIGFERWTSGESRFELVEAIASSRGKLRTPILLGQE